MIKLKIILLAVSLILFSCGNDGIVPVKGNKLKVSLSYDGDSTFKRIGYAIFEGKDINVIPKAAKYENFSNTDLKEAKTFETGKLPKGSYTIVVYGDVDENDGMQPTEKDPIVTENFEIKDKDLSVTLKLKSEGNNPLACMGNSCSKSSECGCDANFCIPQEAAHAGNYEVGICSIIGCSPTVACPSNWNCIENPHGEEGDLSNPKSFCVKEKAVTNPAKVSLKLNYEGDKTGKKINIALMSGQGMPVATKSLKEGSNITFPYEKEIDFDVTNGNYNFIAYLDTDEKDGYKPKDIDPQVIKAIDLEKGETLTLELTLIDK